MALRLFDTPSMSFAPADRTSYMNNTVTPTGQATGYAPRQMGMLSLLGRSLSGVGAAFAGDTQWLQRQQAMDAEQYQADLEWRAALAKQQMDREGASRPVYTFNPATGEYSMKGEVPKGSVVRNMALPLDYQAQKAEILKTAGMLPNLDQANEAVNILKDQFYSAVSPKSVEKGDIKGGLGARASGLGQALQAEAGASPELQTFKNNRGAFASLISKGGFLEAGVLTNQDIERVLRAVPSEFSTKQEADRGWQTVNDILGSARSRYEEKLGKYTTETQSSTSSGWGEEKQKRLDYLRKKLGK